MNRGDVWDFNIDYDMIKPLSQKKKFAILFSLVLLLTIILVNQLEVYIAFLFIALFLIVNHIVYIKIAYNATHLFTTLDRNYKYLVVGDWCNIEELVKGDKFISFLSPEKRSPHTILELVRRLYSLLDEETGILIIVLNEEYSLKKRFSVFDIPFLHEITLKANGIGWMKYAVRLPLLFSPCKSFMLFQDKKVCFKEIECPFPEITRFCNDRGIHLKFKYIK